LLDVEAIKQIPQSGRVRPQREVPHQLLRRAVAEEVGRQHSVIGVELLDEMSPVAMRASQAVNEQNRRAIAAVEIPELVAVQDRREGAPS
jgi:hypothetical protein